MKKNLFALLLAIMVCFSMVLSVSAQNSDRILPLVVDEADLLSESEEKALIAKCETFTNEYQMEIAVLTVPDLEGFTPEAFADDFYDYNGYGFGENDDGLLVLYKPGVEGERQIHITTHGTAEIEFEYSIDFLLDNMIEYLLVEDYNGAFNTFIDDAELTVKKYVSPLWLIVCLGIGVIIGLIITNVIASKNKSVYKQLEAREYINNNSLVVTNSYDNFVRKDVTRTKKAQNTSSGGSHTSSSGRSHGGGGRTF